MQEFVAMSRKELDRYSLLRQVLDKKLTQVRAAELLGLSDRHLRNLLKKFQLVGVQGLVSKKRGRPSNRCIETSFREKVMLLVREKYSDFGPTLATEKLEEMHGITISKETLRQWMMASHLWVGKAQRKKLHPLRQRRACFGEMLQGDGSHHDWFENGNPCCLMYFIDDATNRITSARFEPEETLEGYFEILREQLTHFGVPRSLYTDRFSVFESTLKKDSLTQFRRALNALGIEWIGANSPQAKGRIERCNRTLQDRLLKEMRLRRIKTIEEANCFLEEYLPIFNEKFSKEPMKATDLHRPLEGELNLTRILSKYDERTLTKDLLFQFNNKHYKILEPQDGCYWGMKVEIRVGREGKIRVYNGNIELNVKGLGELIGCENKKDKDFEWKPRTWSKRKMEHPWKRASYFRRLKQEAVKPYGMV